MMQPYFDPRQDLSRCTSGQHARVWLVWSLVNRLLLQEPRVRPSWSELAFSWLLHHATGLVRLLASLRTRIGNWTR